MTSAQFRDLLSSMNIWKRGRERAPHKPLLLLLALGHLVQGSPRLRPYRAIEFELKALLKRFGPPSQIQQPEFPFQYLRSDGLWEVQGLQRDHFNASGRIRAGQVRNSAVQGGLPAEIHAFLIAHPLALRQAIQYLLLAHFPQSVHQDLLNAVRLSEFPLSADMRAESGLWCDPHFHSNVIQAYECQCAVCGYDIQLQDQWMGLEVAYILRPDRGGPDEVPNGLALCAIHHRAFDQGGISLEDNLALLVSATVQSRSRAWSFWFRQFEGQPIQAPNQSRHDPNPHYLQWHRSQVFRGSP